MQVMVQAIDSFIHGSMNVHKGQRLLIDSVMADDLKHVLKRVDTQENKLSIPNKMATGPAENKVATESETKVFDGAAGKIAQSSSSPAAQASQKTIVKQSVVGVKPTQGRGR